MQLGLSLGIGSSAPGNGTDETRPIITVTDEPSLAGIGPVTEGETPAAVAARMTDPGAAVTDGPGGVTTTIEMRVNGAAVGAATGLAAGAAVTIRVIYAAPGAIDALRELGPVTVAPATGQTQTLTHNGASFTVADVTAQGSYADGSRWVVPATGARIVSTAPATVLESGTIGGVAYTGLRLHGMMADPGRAPAAATTLLARQQANARVTGGQGLDARVLIASNLAYDAARNVDPGISGAPLGIAAGQTYAKAVSVPNAPAARETVGAIGLLTVLAAPPAHADACRPAMALPDKTSRWRTSDIVLPAQRSVPGISGLPNYATLVARLNHVVTFLDTDNTNSRNVTPGPGQGYGGDSAEHIAEAALWLIAGPGTLAERTEIARLICQRAEDVRGRVLQGGVWNRNGGWSHWAHVPVLIANRLLPGLFDDALAVTVQDAGGQSVGGSVIPAGAPSLGEFTRVGLVTQAWIDEPAATIPYRRDQLGWPEWLPALGTTQTFAQMDEFQNTLPADGATGFKNPSYRHITAKAMVPVALFLRLTGAPEVSSAARYFDYIDRHMAVLVAAAGDFSDIPGYSSNALSGWVVTAWTALRGTDGLWVAPVPHIAVYGQSEPMIALFYNRGTDTGGVYPALLPGVDVAFVNHPAAEDGASVATPHVVNAAEIAARRVNPGMVAAANLWHRVAGTPLRLSSLTISGTSKAERFDTDTPEGYYAMDEAVIRMSVGLYGPVHRVTDIHYNAEAGAAKTLVTSRAPHFIGRNGDGTPYDFVAGAIEHCMVDTTGRGYGLLGSAAKIDIMMPGLTQPDPVNGEIIPDFMNYTHRRNGTTLGGRYTQLEPPTYAARGDMIAAIPAANRGIAGLAPNLVRYSDHPVVGQSAIHPSSRTDDDGQIRMAQDIMANSLVALGHASLPEFDRIQWASDGTYADLVFRIPDGGTLTTQAILRGQNTTFTRPHQQQVIGAVIRRSGDTRATQRPVFRTAMTDDALYPPAYRGTVAIQDTGTGSGGAREAVVRITPTQPFANGDMVLWHDDGGYSYNLSGEPDHAANLYRHGLRVHLPAWDDGSATAYPGLPVRIQMSAVAAGIGAATAPGPFGASDWSLANPATGGALAVTITALPGTGGSAITAIQYQVNGGAWVTSGLTAPGGFTITGLTNGTACNVALRAVNGVGAGTASATRTATPTAAADPSASRTATADAYLTGPSLGAGVGAITIELDIDVPNGTNGSMALLEFQSQIFRVILDARSGKRGISASFQFSDDANGTGFAGVDGDFPSGRRTLLVTARQNNGSGTAEISLYVNGALVRTATGAAAGTGFFPSNRTLEVLRGTGALTVYRARVWTGFTATGATSGLGAPRHDISGVASVWNAPAAPLVKAGTGSFA